MTNPKLAEIIYEAIEQWSCESDTKTEAIFKEAIQQAYELGREDERCDLLEIFDGNRPEFKDIHPQLQRACEIIRSRRKGNEEKR